VARNRSQYFFLNAGSLVFIYASLCALTVFFSRSFFSSILYHNDIPNVLTIAVFFSIPATLFIFLIITISSIIGDVRSRELGVKFKLRLLGYFITIVVFAAAPMFVVTGISLQELLRFYRSINADAATQASNSFAVENFYFHLERFNRSLEAANWDDAGTLPLGIAAVQYFRLDAEGEWLADSFLSGDEHAELLSVPSFQEGFIMRELPRDRGFIRHVAFSDSVLRVASYALTDNFDDNLASVALVNERFQTIEILRDNVQTLTFFFYGIFFFPTLLMTLIIAMSFTKRLSTPIAELTQATRRVAAGDFSRSCTIVLKALTKRPSSSFL
jgi:nitrogen fixation/metabolism regulation signal transduction histidine kinase